MQSSAKAWSEQVAALRALAATLQSGTAQDELLAQADQLETAVQMLDVLAVKRPKRPA